jgi:HAD superfamily hydrolase (TIGR01490 family)
MNIAFFDFDGTITSRDSLPDFIAFAVGKPKYYLGLFILSPILFLYVIKIIPNDIAKQKLLSHFFKDWKVDRFEKIAEQYSLLRIDIIVRSDAIERISWHQLRGDKVVVVSASVECWLSKWCENNNLGLIATQLESHAGSLTGRFKTKNCHGLEKVNRINREYCIADFEKTYAYGDSSGDREMLVMADNKYYRCFK